ncbi:hypothetical protein H5410_037245 [Solanum commersonii]|uniref:Uncharacterized protein n=1 Tax=Solanum commersonii TaxID=4109 RepID=A0A9J5Y781_SOLCO|nr:hypothetical protein H5410_037245 [Solanum commersonii]
MEKKVSEIDRSTVECVFCNKQSKGGIFRHKKHLMGTSNNVVRCSIYPNVVRKEIRRYVEEKKDLKHQILHQPDVTNLDDNDDEEMKEGEAVDLSLHTKSQKRAMNAAISSSCGSTGLPFNCVNYTDTSGAFIEPVGQCGPGMKPLTYHEDFGEVSGSMSKSNTMQEIKSKLKNNPIRLEGMSAKSKQSNIKIVEGGKKDQSAAGSSKKRKEKTTNYTEENAKRKKVVVSGLLEHNEVFV